MNDSFLKKHHAFLILSDDDSCLEGLKSFLSDEYGFNCNSNNPDFWQWESETLGIDESRELKEKHTRKAISGKEKIFIIKASSVTNEAQNALLKVLEDPLPHNYFFFILPSEDLILKTLLSRFMVLKDTSFVSSGKYKSLSFDINKFLSSGNNDRLKILSEIINDKDKVKALNFLAELETILDKKIDIKNMNEDYVLIFDSIIKSRNYLKGRSASVKIILENLSLIIPQI